jgi:hypothetical protein
MQKPRMASCWPSRFAPAGYFFAILCAQFGFRVYHSPCWVGGSWGQGWWRDVRHTDLGDKTHTHMFLGHNFGVRRRMDPRLSALCSWRCGAHGSDFVLIFSIFLHPRSFSTLGELGACFWSVTFAFRIGRRRKRVSWNQEKRGHPRIFFT